jgi:hypothetical protein
MQRGQDIDGEADCDQSGYFYDDDGNTVAIGAIFNYGTAHCAGHVSVYLGNQPTKDPNHCFATITIDFDTSNG